MKKRDAYARAGVDVARVRDMQGSIAAALGSTFSLREGRFGAPLMKIGHYAGLIDIGHGDALALHTDGVGTKVLVAIQQERFDTVGIDCVAMTVNDLICVGSEPVALLDYIALEKDDDRLVSELTKGLVEGAKRASTAIVGGETAIMGNVRGFDLVSMGVGVVKKDRILDGSSISAGDRVIGVASSGLHSNGYTLARKVLLSKRSAGETVPELGMTIGDAMLAPTLIYVKPVLEVLKRREVHGVAHITGGAFTKLTRLVGGRNLGFALENRAAPPIFGLIQREGGLSKKEMYCTFNMGVGLCVCAPETEEDAIIGAFQKHGFDAFDFGEVVRGSGVRVGKTRLAV
jgi:phosphoribosylformylglycinamidine cyclo-ligase